MQSSTPANAKQDVDAGRALATSSTGADLYLELLKKSLTNNLFKKEPEVSGGDDTRFVIDFMHHYINAPAVSMLPLVRFHNLEACIIDVIEQKIPGDLIETGVWRGGATIFMRAVLKAYGEVGRTVWVADSFEGLPEPDAEKFPIERQAHDGPVMKTTFKHFAVDLEEVRGNFKAYDLLDNQVRFLKGWFKDTLPSAPIKALAVMRLDGDYYESTMDALVNLYDRLSIGGYVIIDDYGESSWTYCRKAVDDFRRDRGILDPLKQVDSICSYWQRTR
jgi:macrocin-O-methyltransferase TylF-like protien